VNVLISHVCIGIQARLADLGAPASRR
jgi:hypothetical protein